MKTLIILFTLALSSQAFSQAYVIKPNRWGDSYVSFPGVTGDLFATHVFQNSKGAGWKNKAIAYIENETDAVEISGKIEDGTISEHCEADWESIDYVDIEGLSYKWKALKSLGSSSAKTVLYVVETYGDYVINLENGKKIDCPYLINEYVFLNKTPFAYLGQTEK